VLDCTIIYTFFGGQVLSICAPLGWAYVSD